MWATIAEMERPLPSAGFAFQAAGSMLSTKYRLMRLLVLKALSKADGSWLANAGAALAATVGWGVFGTEVFRMRFRLGNGLQFGIGLLHLQGAFLLQALPGGFVWGCSK